MFAPPVLRLGPPGFTRSPMLPTYRCAETSTSLHPDKMLLASLHVTIFDSEAFVSCHYLILPNTTQGEKLWNLLEYWSNS